MKGLRQKYIYWWVHCLSLPKRPTSNGNKFLLSKIPKINRMTRSGSSNLSDGTLNNTDKSISHNFTISNINKTASIVPVADQPEKYFHITFSLFFIYNEKAN